MKLELKNLKVNEAFSEETTMFKADLYADGVKIAYASNDGRGGCTNYLAYPNQLNKLKEVEEYAKTLPQLVEQKFSTKYNLENWIDDTIYLILIEKAVVKANKQIQKACETHIVWGEPNSDAYTKIGFKGKPKFADLVKTTNGKVALQNLLNKVKKELKTNEIIYNKNLTDLIW